jgi:ABC-type microcin C transport system permease subunit YejE
MKKILMIIFVVSLGCSAFAQDKPVLVNYNTEKAGTLQQTPLTFGQKMVLFRVKKAVPLQLMADWISLTETELLGIEVRYSIEDYKSIERDNLIISKQSEKHLLFLMMKYQMLY